MGIPVLTYCGKTFAGRVAASLLTCLDLEDLITYSSKEYVSKAIELYSSPEKMTNLKQRLAENLKTKPLFNTRLYVNNLEVLYLEMYRRHLSGLPPETFSFDDVKLA
jgi:predicted O-linked N-acetylglucosamine transferase (SPINDLY family)